MIFRAETYAVLKFERSYEISSTVNVAILLLLFAKLKLELNDTMEPRLYVGERSSLLEMQRG